MTNELIYSVFYPLEVRVYPYGVHIRNVDGTQKKYFLIQNNKLMEIDETLFEKGTKEKSQSRCF